MKFKFVFSILVFLLIFLFESFSINEEASQHLENTLLWEIKNPNSKKSSFLYGTMHLIQKEYFNFPNELRNQLEKSDVLVMEIAGSPSQAEVMQLMLLPNGSLFDIFNNQQKDSLYNWSKSTLGLEKDFFVSTFSKMKPFVIVQTATQMQFLGNTESYEAEFEKIAKEKNIPIHGLETLEEQIGFIDNLTEQDKVLMVMESIKSDKNSKKEMMDIQRVYSKQNLDSIYLLMHKDNGFIAKQEAVLLTNRNKNWILKIKDISSDKQAFIAVGAGHLPGENGLINLLKNEGFIVKPIFLKN